MPKLIDLTGKRFGRLVVIKRAGTNHYNKPTWYCVCDCGNYAIVNAHELRNGDTKSCGCYRDEQIRIPHFTHSGSKDRLYKIWAFMKTRCTNTKCKDYKNYGGRGIQVCNEWRDCYENFRSWACISGYDPSALRGECTIDRINVNNKCKWKLRTR